MKIYVKAAHYDMWGNKIPDDEQINNTFIVTKTYTIYTEDDIQNDIFEETGTSLEEFESVGLYKPGRGVVLPVGTQLVYTTKDYYFAYYALPQYNNIEVGVSTDEWFNLRKHIKFLNPKPVKSTPKKEPTQKRRRSENVRKVLEAMNWLNPDYSDKGKYYYSLKWTWGGYINDENKDTIIQEIFDKTGLKCKVSQGYRGSYRLLIPID